jgi:hypothetical protein
VINESVRFLKRFGDHQVDRHDDNTSPIDASLGSTCCALCPECRLPSSAGRDRPHSVQLDPLMTKRSIKRMGAPFNTNEDSLTRTLDDRGQ